MIDTGSGLYNGMLCAIKSENYIYSVFYEFKRITIYFVAKVKEKTMANKKFWLGISVMVLVFGIMVVGCDGGTQYDNSAKLEVTNKTGSTLYISDTMNDKGVPMWSSLSPDQRTFFLAFWNDDDANRGVITIYYQIPSATYWTTQTYYLSKDEIRTVEIRW